MRIQWDVPVSMDDGVVLRADVFRPIDGLRVPAIVSYGPYGKGLHFADGFPLPWSLATEGRSDVLEGSSNTFQNFEVVDPEKFVPDGYAIVRVDSRGMGRSPGYVDPWSSREAQDLYACIEWCAGQDWCSGKIGLSGTSYLAMNQWQAAALQPPSLAAICVWEGACDIYREMVRHGGILSTFGKVWFESAILAIQHGKGRRGHRSRYTGDWVSGPDTLPDEVLEANRRDWPTASRDPRLATDDFWRSRIPDLAKITVPVLSTANWGGQGLHLRGNLEGFAAVSSTERWLDVHCMNHWLEYYTAYGVALQKQFFGCFLKGDENGWRERPPVHICVRRPGPEYAWRFENEWPLARTVWTRLHLHRERLSLEAERPNQRASVEYRGFGPGVTFLTAPMETDIELTGPLAAKLFVSSSTTDADIFLVLRAFGPDMAELTFPGHVDPHTPLAQGWLRASHRKLDQERSLPHRPYHAHDEIEPLEPHRVYELDIEILPTCVVIPAGYRLALSVRGRDYEYPAAAAPTPSNPRVFTGVGQFRHNDGIDRPPSIYDGLVTVYSGPEHPSHLLIPIVPPQCEGKGERS